MIYWVRSPFCVVLFLLSSACEANESVISCIDSMHIEKTSYDAQGVLELRVGYEFCEMTKVYDWRGHLYPILNYSLFARAVASNGSLLNVKNVEQILPKIYHPKDVVETKSFMYQKPLRLMISRDDEKPHRECFEFQLQYNTTGIRTPHTLSKIDVHSNKIEVCDIDK